MNRVGITRVMVAMLLSLLLVDCITVRRTRADQTRSRGTSDQSYLEARIGQRFPSDLDEGTTFEVGFGRELDNRLYLLGDASYFRTTYRELTDIVTGEEFTDNQLEFQFSTRVLSTYAHVAYMYPDYSRRQIFYLRSAVGGGLEIIQNREQDFETEIDRTRWFLGLGMQASVGVGARISDRGTFFLDLTFKNSNVSKSRREREAGFPTFTSISLTGGGIRGGLSFRF